jgi:hypothetical protein
MQQEPIVRLLAADLVDRAAVLEQRRLLEINHRYAARLVALQREWLREAPGRAGVTPTTPPPPPPAAAAGGAAPPSVRAAAPTPRG